jgi:hypothetical protein
MNAGINICRVSDKRSTFLHSGIRVYKVYANNVAGKDLGRNASKAMGLGFRV